jgi:hypothetical protein
MRASLRGVILAALLGVGGCDADDHHAIHEFVPGDCIDPHRP